jgi:hypothetical protein
MVVIQYLHTVWEFVGASSDQIVALAAGAAAVFTYLGLRTWRRQLKGASEYALAKDLLKAVYRVREGFMHVRNPMMFSYEYPEHARDSWGHAKPELKAEALEYAYQNRWKYLHEAWTNLEEKNLEAQVEWGPEYQMAIRPLRRCRVELQLAIEDVISAVKPNAKSPTAAAKERDEKKSMLQLLSSKCDFVRKSVSRNQNIAIGFSDWRGKVWRRTNYLRTIFGSGPARIF